MAFAVFGFLALLLVVICLLAVVMLVVYVGVLVFSFLVAIISLICWLVIRRKNKERGCVPLTVFISYCIIFGVLAVVPQVIIHTSQEEGYYTDLGVYVEQTEDEIRLSEAITFMGAEYKKSDLPMFYDKNCLGLVEKIPVANIPQCTDDMVYRVENSAGVTILCYSNYYYFTEEGEAAAEEYYSSLTEPHTVVANDRGNIRYEYDIAADLDIAHFNALYCQWENGLDAGDYLGSADAFYIFAVSGDGVSTRSVRIGYDDSGDIFLYRGSYRYAISDSAALQALAPIVDSYKQSADD